MTTTDHDHLTASLQHAEELFIGGEWVSPYSRSTFDLIFPHTEGLNYRVAMANKDDMSRAVASAQTAFDDGPWPRMSPVERAGYLRAIATGLQERGLDLAKMWANEVGVVYSFAKAGTADAGGAYSYYADLAETFPFVERHPPSTPGEVALQLREPVGVVGAIIPWNSGTGASAYKVAPALLAGCTVVAKASPESPSALYVLAEVAEAVGLPPGVLNCLTADREVSESLVLDPRVNKVAFTGSTAAGRRIASICGERIARFTLELGGKSAAVILDDYEPEKVATAMGGSATRMTGQTCASLTRVIVSESRHDELVEALATALAAVKVGDPFDPSSQMGPLATQRQRNRVEHYIAKGREEGATLVTGGGRPAGLDKGYYVEPTLFARVDNHSTIAREEIFGPVLSVIAAKDERHAIQMANDTDFGLNNAVFTNDPDRALQVARQLRSGNVGHNAARYNFNVAFGGFKRSGIGREGGREGLLPYLESKTVLLDAEPTSLPIDNGEL
jgi:aldehyde dehydrogenase (NAD+)